MRVIRQALLFAPLCVLGACAEAPAPAPAPDSQSDQCQATSFRGLTGQPRSVLGKMTLPAGTRVIGPLDPVTMDYRANRLNFEIGQDGKIAKIACY